MALRVKGKAGPRKDGTSTKGAKRGEALVRVQLKLTWLKKVRTRDSGHSNPALVRFGSRETTKGKNLMTKKPHSQRKKGEREQERESKEEHCEGQIEMVDEVVNMDGNDHHEHVLTSHPLAPSTINDQLSPTCTLCHE